MRNRLHTMRREFWDQPEFRTPLGMYKGWTLSQSRTDEYGELFGPVTGRFRAVRFGVGMGAGTMGQLVRMIDTRTKEESA